MILRFENGEERLRFFHLAESHMILPMVMDACANASDFPYYAKRAYWETITQAQRSADFLLLYEYLKGKELSPLILKGILCRSLYLNPEQRLSADEDFLIDPEDVSHYHEALLAYGLQPADPAQDIRQAYEITYTEKDSLLYLEVHTQLFPPSSAYSRLNDLFADIRARSISEKVYSTVIRTLSCRDHLLYLILHAYKHFLYSGFGIRQCADILLYSLQYQNEIDWNSVQNDLVNAGAYDFSRAIYKIGFVHLLKTASFLPEDWNICSIDEVPLLEDIMASGLYGTSSFSRLHSSNITLHAMEESGKGSGVLRSIFLPLDSMKGKYPYLKKAPYLLPFAWIQRIRTYVKESKQVHADDMLESVKIGRGRVELLKMYHMIPDKH